MISIVKFWLHTTDTFLPSISMSYLTKLWILDILNTLKQRFSASS